MDPASGTLELQRGGRRKVRRGQGPRRSPWLWIQAEGTMQAKALTRASVWGNSQGELGCRAESQVVGFAPSTVRQPDRNREERPRALLLPRLLVIPACRGPRIHHPEAPRRGRSRGPHPLGEVISTPKAKPSSDHIQGPQLRIRTFFPRLQKCQSPISSK